MYVFYILTKPGGAAKSITEQNQAQSLVLNPPNSRNYLFSNILIFLDRRTWSSVHKLFTETKAELWGTPQEWGHCLLDWLDIDRGAQIRFWSVHKLIVVRAQANLVPRYQKSAGRNGCRFEIHSVCLWRFRILQILRTIRIHSFMFFENSHLHFDLFSNLSMYETVYAWK